MEKFGGMIGVGNLLGLVKSTAPFLFTDAFSPPELSGRLIERGAHPMGWLSILRAASDWRHSRNPTQEQREDYFALCMACHHATVATFVPTDVDTKIRGHLWNETSNKDSLRRMFTFVEQAILWDRSRITTRESGLTYKLSGHNGEWLSVLAGALGAFLRVGDSEFAERAHSAIEADLLYEAKSFEEAMQTEGAEIELLKLSTLLTHNVGDLDQGISYWKSSPAHQPYQERLGRLAHENTKPYNGVFQAAAHVNKKIMSPEGHRNYPLREVKALRASPDFLFPISPFLDDWGAKLASHLGLGERDKSDLLGALLFGCKQIKGQQGYYRAIAGIYDVLGGRVERLLAWVPTALRQEAKSAELKRHLLLDKSSFESSMKKRAQQALAELKR